MNCRTISRKTRIATTLLNFIFNHSPYCRTISRKTRIATNRPIKIIINRSKLQNHIQKNKDCDQKEPLTAITATDHSGLQNHIQKNKDCDPFLTFLIQFLFQINCRTISRKTRIATFTMFKFSIAWFSLQNHIQ